MRMSEISMEDVKQYCHIDHAEEDSIVVAAMEAAKSFICAQTGLTAEEADEKDDLVIAFYILAAEFFDNRAYSVEGKQVSVSPAAKAIIDQYCKNIL